MERLFNAWIDRTCHDYCYFNLSEIFVACTVCNAEDLQLLKDGIHETAECYIDNAIRSIH